jgi:DNA-binding transcriptional MerR regulator
MDALTERRVLVTPPRKLFKIGEVMQYSGLSRQTVHNYTIWGLISEAERTASGHRLYGEEVFERLRRVEALKKDGHTLQEIRRLLDEERRP